MTIVDVIVILVVVSAVAHGLWLGATIQLVSLAGTGTGLVVGAVLAPRIVPESAGSPHQGLITLLVVFGFASFGGALGRALGVRVWGRVRRWAVARVDAALGAAMAGVGGLLGCWLIASMVLAVPVPDVAEAVQRSLVLRAVDSVLPPAPKVLARVRGLLDERGLPPVFADFEPAPAEPVPQPLPAEVSAAAARGRASTVRITGLACAAVQSGSGVVVGRGLVVTNAHVVAGVDRPVVQAGTARLPATTVHFDDDLDIAVVRVDGLRAPALVLAATDAPRGTRGAALGFPGGGPFRAEPAAVRRSFEATGRDIYNRDLVQRPVYELQAHVRPGNSGGPVVTAEGTVIGVVFSRSAFREDIGYAIRSSVVAARVRGAGRLPADTGPCA